MSQIGKAIRLERIMNRDTGRTIIVPMDHGVSLGPVPGLIDMADMVNKVAEGGADAVLGHIGLPLYGHRRYGRDIGLILHLMGSSVLSPDPNNKVMVMTVEEAGELLGISRPHAYKLVKEGQIPIIRLGRRLIVPKAALEKMLANAGTQNEG